MLHSEKSAERPSATGSWQAVLTSRSPPSRFQTSLSDTSNRWRPTLDVQFLKTARSSSRSISQLCRARQTSSFDTCEKLRVTAFGRSVNDVCES
ncbi:hypothetical protein BIW11_10747 [Tropilaelaps mercedesae]|uniref:Uncharacterized protein n=1 Tax=Tropilaelaps mercedesae TaxID=418985 RepID=A0A1V9XEP9_9ACAR|nr:hypothetical protein BIW11_10747 [Tropilaelaps mercedesae]